MGNILITGANGFVSGHLLKHIKGHIKDAVIGLDIREASERRPFNGYVEYDLSSVKGQLPDILRDISPRLIFHLAGVNKSPNFRDFYRVNVFGTINLLEAVNKLRDRIAPHIFIPGSAAEYGIIPPEVRGITETNPLNPVNYYGNSKVSQTLLGIQYHKSQGLKTRMVRMFNLIGSGQPEEFVCSYLCKQVARIKKGIQSPVLTAGNLDAKRDFIDVRDAVRFIWKLINSDRYDGEVFNVGSGEARSVRDIIEITARTANVDVKIKQDKSIIKERGVDIPVQVCDSTKARNAFGWKTEMPVEESLKDMVSYWLERM